MLYLDLDQFKVVNDTCGHQAGDRLLKQITSVLQTRIRTSDTLARLGGDEFGVLLQDCTLDMAQRIAEDLRQAIRDFRFVWQDRVMNVGVSIGLAEMNGDADTLSTIMSAADVACYSAKESGRNRVHIYNEGHAPERHREMQWVSRINRACEEDRLVLYCQPIVPIRARRRAAAAVRAAAAHARRERPARAADRVHPGGRALQPDAGASTAGWCARRASTSRTGAPTTAARRAVHAHRSTSRRRRSTTSSSSTT